MKIAQLLTVAMALLWVGHSQAQTYAPIQAPGIFVTGIRSNSSTTDDVVITASFNNKTVTTACPQPGQAALYVGSLQAVASSPLTSWICFQPNFPNQTVTDSTFYGPNTPVFDTSLGTGNVRAVGSYQYTGNGNNKPKSLHGMMYTGPVAGCPNASTSCWTQLDATSLLHGDEQLDNTVPHSTMGNLVVGNWNTKSKVGHAFIYDIAAGTFLDIHPTASLSVTAYGIWQNSDGTYTIAGGSSDLNKMGVDEGYLVDYDPSNKIQPFSHVTKYQFNNQPSQISHFDGITINPNGGYNLTGVYVVNAKTTGGFFVTVTRNQDGSFAPTPSWTPINFAYQGIQKVILTTGNTVIDNYVLGIFNGVIVGGGRATLSYIASVP